MPVRAADLETRLYATDREYNRTLADAERRAEKFARNVNAQFSKAGQGAGGSGGGGFGFGGIAQSLKMLPGLGTLASALGAVTGAMQDGIKFGFDYNRTLEESQLAFTKLLGSPGQAEAHIRALQRLRKEGVSLEESAASSRRFQAARFDLEQIPTYIAAVGDAARITGAEVDAITRALTQMASKGRVSAEEVNQQLAEQGIPAWRYLADAVAEVDKNFAKLTADERIRKVQKMAELGQLSGMGGAQAILRGIQKDFGGFSREFAEQTASGAEMLLESTAQRLAGTATGPLFERYKGLLRGVLNIANSETGDALARGAASGTNAAFNVIDESLKQGGNIGAGLLKGAAGSGFEAAKQFIGDFAKGIGAQSPATEFMPLGAYAAQGFKVGFSAEMSRGGGVMGLFQNVGGMRLSPAVSAHDATIEEMARKYGLDPNLLRAMMQQESGGRVGAVSPKGASGPMQLMPATARRFGVTNIFDPRQNIEGAAKYIRFLTDTFKGDLDKILAGYNAGEGAVMKYGGVPPYAETRNYVASIKSNYGRMGGATAGGGGMASQDSLFAFMLQDPAFRDYMKRTYSHHAYIPGTRDLQGGTGVFADNFRDVPAGSGLDEFFRQSGPIVGKLDEEIQQTYLDVTKLTAVFMRPLEPFPGGVEQVEALNNEIRQTVPILMKAKQEASFLGITGKDAAETFQDAWSSAFTRTDLDFKGMASSFVLTFAQSINAMVQQWAAAQISAGLGKFLSWGIGAITGGFGGGGSGVGSGSILPGGVGIGTSIAPRFATGGSFMVGGPGGTDKTPVSFLATKGERVTVETPAQARSRGATVINNHVTNIIYSPRVTPSSYTSRRSGRESFEALLALAR